MLVENNCALFLLIILTFVPLVSGLSGFLNNKNNDSSMYYMTLNHIIAAALMSVILIIHVLYILHWQILASLKQSAYYCLISGILAMNAFIIGIHGMLNKEKIANDNFYRFSRQLFILSIMGGFGLVLWWLKWKSF